MESRQGGAAVSSAKCLSCWGAKSQRHCKFVLASNNPLGIGIGIGLGIEVGIAVAVAPSLPPPLLFRGQH